MPAFWLGLMLMLIFSVTFRVLPAYGAEEPKSIIMPALALGTGMAARLSLDPFLDAGDAGAGLYPHGPQQGAEQPDCGHAPRPANGLIPVVTAFGLQLGWLLGGSVVVESVFSWPGLGRLMIESIHIRDITVVQAGLHVLCNVICGHQSDCGRAVYLPSTVVRYE